jgi:guanylate kinase
VPDELVPPPAQALLIVLSGPSGAGKDSVVQRIKARGLPFHFVITATTRPRRPDEVDGVNYFFVTRERFSEMVERGELLEHAMVYEECKGIPKGQVRQALATGKDVLMRIDVQGAETIREMCPEALLIFLRTRTEEELIARLKRRKTETPESLGLRIATARKELQRIDLFDYFVVNADGELEAAVDTVLAIVEAEHHRTHPRQVRL